MTESEMLAATARENVFRYLAACYYEPDPMFAEEGLFASLEEAAGGMHDALLPHARRLAEEFARTDAGELLLDYTRLFLGPLDVLARPYGSAWLENEKTLMGETTQAVAELYREGGFGIDDDFTELPDHIAVELEFLYLLLYREHEAQLAEDPDRTHAISDLKRRFLDQHLGRWIKPFSAALAAGAQTDFYRELAAMTAQAVNLERVCA